MFIEWIHETSIDGPSLRRKQNTGLWFLFLTPMFLKTPARPGPWCLYFVTEWSTWCHTGFWFCTSMCFHVVSHSNCCCCCCCKKSAILCQSQKWCLLAGPQPRKMVVEFSTHGSQEEEAADECMTPTQVKRAITNVCFAGLLLWKDAHSNARHVPKTEP